MKLLLLLSLACLAQSQPPAPSGLKSGQPKQTSTATEDGKGQADKDPPQPVTISVVNSPEIQHATKDHQEEPSSDWWMRIFTGLIFLATAVQAYIYWRQKQLMREALGETERAANAAKDSAMAMMNSERAWVVVQPAHAAPTLIAAVPGISGAPQHMFCFRIWNAGKTTATEVKAFAWYVMVDTLEELPVSPQYGVLEDFPNGVLIPTNQPVNGEHSLWTCRMLQPNPILLQSDIEAIESRKKFLFAYGKVTYKNGVGSDCFIAFGFVYNAPMEGDWRPKGYLNGGPPGYNKAT